MNSKLGFYVNIAVFSFAIFSLFPSRTFAQPATPKLGQYVERRLFDAICPVRESVVARRVFAEYGAVFVADNVRIPDKCVFSNEAEVQEFQQTLSIKNAVVRGVRIELQKAAMDSLMEVIIEANSRNLQLTPLDGSIAARRSYTDTVRIWNSRFLPALDHWISGGKLTVADANEARSLDVHRQVEKVMDWESKGIFFSTNFTRSIFSSTAPPGTSQHLTLIALDIQEHDNPELRDILARHGWYQTVKDDVTHFTFLGVPESELPARGLRLTAINSCKFWLPDVD
jgi:hypothetical protein